ncbi:MAG TPA: SDR family oxidoreductase [Alloacidobacterium sp.]|nr:SDR family oxidoreductase [Alloacidobacterium sp.]
MLQDEQRVALVTGSRKGLGKFIAQQLVGCGYAVFGCSRTSADWAVEGYRHLEADVGNEHEIKEVVAEIRRSLGRLDVVVNNAGIASLNHFLMVPASTVDRLMATNFRGAWLVSREAAKLMMKARYGRIVNLTTVAVPMRIRGEALYAASKAAVETMTRVLAYELGEFGITVNAVGPTPIDTDLIQKVPAASIQAIIDCLAIKRKGQPEDVMNVIEFLIRPASNYVTGQVIYLGGA